MNKDYSKREIDIFMKDIHEKLDRILDQTTKTNGRVTSLENWRGFIMGGIAVIAAVLIPVIIKVMQF